MGPAQNGILWVEREKVQCTFFALVLHRCTFCALVLHFFCTNSALFLHFYCTVCPTCAAFDINCCKMNGCTLHVFLHFLEKCTAFFLQFLEKCIAFFCTFFKSALHFLQKCVALVAGCAVQRRSMQCTFWGCAPAVARASRATATTVGPSAACRGSGAGGEGGGSGKGRREHL